MKLVTYTHGASQKPGLVEGDHVRDLSQIAPSMLDLVRMGSDGIGRVAEHAATAPPVALSEVRLLAPISPGKILCSGINYKGHADENPNAVMPQEPFFFAKLPNAIAGPDDEVSKTLRTDKMDYEAEFAVVIGKRLCQAKQHEVMPAIFGYTLLNDISARDVQFKDMQITLGKNFDRFSPIGPCIVTADELTQPDKVGLRTRLNGRLLQDGSTSDWLFSLPELIVYLTQAMTLEPGDIVSTGTPAGVGVFQKPQVFMQPGDLIEIEADGIGTLRNRIVA